MSEKEPRPPISSPEEPDDVDGNQSIMSRREFLRKSTAAVAGAALAGSSEKLLAQQADELASDPLEKASLPDMMIGMTLSLDKVKRRFRELDTEEDLPAGHEKFLDEWIEEVNDIRKKVQENGGQAAVKMAYLETQRFGRYMRTGKTSRSPDNLPLSSVDRKTFNDRLQAAAIHKETGAGKILERELQVDKAIEVGLIKERASRAGYVLEEIALKKDGQRVKKLAAQITEKLQGYDFNVNETEIAFALFTTLNERERYWKNVPGE